MRVLVVEPYYGGSHRAWADGYREHSAHDVALVTHPARFWKWRMHGAFLTLAREVDAWVVREGVPDVVLASSMFDVAAFAGATRSRLADVPIAVYLHESQFTYPLSPLDRVDLTYAMKNWASAAVADLVLFNSRYHRSVFETEASTFLGSFPEYVHGGFLREVMEGARVIPVGVDADVLAARPRTPDEPPTILWNHRWEHDKGPDELHAVVRALIRRDVDFTMAMCGEVFVSVPPAYDAVVGTLGDRLVHRGWAERSRYEELLSTARVVLSTADQEFFGIGIVEGVAAGAHPVLPDRLVYPERVEELGADPASVLYRDADHAAELIIDALRAPEDPALRTATHRYDWSVVASELDEALAQLAQ